MLFEGHVGVEVGLGGSEVGVAEPEGDDCGVDASVEECHRAAVPQDVGVELGCVQCRAGCSGSGGVFANETLNGVGAEASSGSGGEEWFAAGAGSFVEPHGHDRFGGCGQRNGSVFAAFADAANVRTASDAHVSAIEPDEFRHAKPGLHGE